MTWSKDLTTPYHQQDTSYYCGAAVAQMILDSIGAGILDQNMLYNMNHSHSAPGWYTSPDGLNYTLNQLMPPPPTFNSFFIISRSNTEPDGSQEIVRTLYYYGVATGTLVEACGHWIAVRGVQTDIEPAPGNSYTIQGFWVNNPWPPTPSPAPPPPHSDPDLCGTGGNRGIANEYAAYNGFWKSTYFTGCDVYGVGHPQFVSVVDPRRPALGEFRVRGEERHASGDRLISSKEVVEIARAALLAHGLHDTKQLTGALRNAHPGTPILVQRLDKVDTFYYLVPMQRGGESTALVSIDGLYGTFNGAHGLAEPTRSLIVPREEVLKLLVNQTVNFDERLGGTIIREGALCFYPTMVWRPCWESRSPYYPFYQITVGGNQIYVGYDGTVYPVLHDLGKG